MYFLVLGCIIATIAYVAFCYVKIKNMPEGTEKMQKMAAIIRDGATTFMVTEYKTIAIVVAIVTVVLTCFIEVSSGMTFILGACMSTCVCVLGMRSATYANVRTANKARESRSIGETVKVALIGGSISGLAVQACGLLGIVVILLVQKGVDPDAVSSGLLLKSSICNPTTTRVMTYSLGCSLVAMFNRVAGGNFTKSADIGADSVGKDEFGLEEDDPRNAAVMADSVGDNVNDIAGNCSDLLESFVATISGALSIAVYVYGSAKADGMSVAGELLSATCLFPVMLAGAGLLSSLIALFMAAKSKMGDNPSKELNKATYATSALTIIIGLIAAKASFGNIALYSSFKLGWISPWVASVMGIASGVAIGKVTEYFTSADYKPTQRVAEAAIQGPSFVVSAGDALGSKSCLPPVAIIAVSLVIAGLTCGAYGLAIAALGMLSFVAETVSIDAFGPISDNAGGLASACELDEEVREITDKLDSVGNTTAAIGKGFAIGSAAFAASTLLMSFVGSYTKLGLSLILNMVDYKVLGGAFIGAALIELFSGMLTDNTVKSATLMANECRRQLRIPDVINKVVDPDYNLCIGIATKKAISSMGIPSIIALMVPVVFGLLGGNGIIGGVIAGSVLYAVPRALFMGNSGGAFDNAKKYIESGAIEGHGKGTEAHKAAVNGDTVGDIRKDVVGVALDIFIKMMATVANVVAPIVATVR